MANEKQHSEIFVTTVKLPLDVYNSMKELAAADDRTFSSLLIKVCREYVNTHTNNSN